MKLECQECGNRFHTDDYLDPDCPKCGSTNLDVIYSQSAEPDGTYI